MEKLNKTMEIYYQILTDNNAEFTKEDIFTPETLLAYH